MAKYDPDDPKRFSDTQTAGYAAREIAKSTNKSDIAVAVVNGGFGVVRELFSVMKTNPIVGVVGMAVTVDLLAQAKIISARCESFCYMVLGVAFGVSVTLAVVEGIGAVIDAANPFSSGGATAPDPADLIKPTMGGGAYVDASNVRYGRAEPMSQGTNGIWQLSSLIPKALPAAA